MKILIFTGLFVAQLYFSRLRKNYNFTCEVDMFYGGTMLEIANPEDEEDSNN